MKKAQKKQEVKKEVKQEELKEVFAAYHGEVVPCVELCDNHFTGSTLVGMFPKDFGNKIVFKETASIDFGDIFDNEEDARYHLLRIKQRDLREDLEERDIYIKNLFVKKEKNLVRLLLFFLAFDITLLIGFCLLAAGVK